MNSLMNCPSKARQLPLPYCFRTLSTRIHSNRQRQEEEQKNERTILTPRGRNQVTFWTSSAIFVLLPYSVVKAPSRMGDILLGIAMPIHFHIGMNHVIEDYFYKPHIRHALRVSMNFITSSSILAALHFNLYNGGIGMALRKLFHL